MPLLNYTTKVASEKTVLEIQKILARAKAKAILTEYDDDQVLTAVSFQIEHQGQILSFRLPAKIESIYSVLIDDPDIGPRFCNREQASRTCWRILKDWVEAQMALIEADQAELPELFLPHLQDGSGVTLYERLEQNNFSGLITHQE